MIWSDAPPDRGRDRRDEIVVVPELRRLMTTSPPSRKLFGWRRTYDGSDSVPAQMRLAFIHAKSMRPNIAGPAGRLREEITAMSRMTTVAGPGRGVSRERVRRLVGNAPVRVHQYRGAAQAVGKVPAHRWPSAPGVSTMIRTGRRERRTEGACLLGSSDPGSTPS